MLTLFHFMASIILLRIVILIPKKEIAQHERAAQIHTHTHTHSHSHIHAYLM